jgi:hypothetical protein
MCKFDKSWVGQCKNVEIEGSDYCQEHHGLKCAICGVQATHDCEETMGSFVCGTKLCSNQECRDRHFANHEYNLEISMCRWRNKEIAESEDEFKQFIKEHGGTIGLERMLDLFVSAWFRVDVEKVISTGIHEKAYQIRNEKAYRDLLEKRAK